MINPSALYRTTSDRVLSRILIGTGEPGNSLNISDDCLNGVSFIDFRPLENNRFKLLISDALNNRILIYDGSNEMKQVGTGEPGLRNGDFTVAQFNNPTAAIWDDVEILVSDADNHMIRHIGYRSVTTFSGSEDGHEDGPREVAKFGVPGSLVYGHQNELIICDPGYHCIRKISSGNIVTTLTGQTKGYKDGFQTEALFSTPVSITSDSAGNIYVIEMEHPNIRKIDNRGEVSTFLTLEEPATFIKYYLGYLLILNDKSLYYYDLAASKLTKIECKEELTGPSGLTVGLNHSLIVANDCGYQIIELQNPGNWPPIFDSSSPTSDTKSNDVEATPIAPSLYRQPSVGGGNPLIRTAAQSTRNVPVRNSTRSNTVEKSPPPARYSTTIHTSIPLEPINQNPLPPNNTEIVYSEPPFINPILEYIGESYDDYLNRNPSSSSSFSSSSNSTPGNSTYGSQFTGGLDPLVNLSEFVKESENKVYRFARLQSNHPLVENLLTMLANNPNFELDYVIAVSSATQTRTFFSTIEQVEQRLQMVAFQTVYNELDGALEERKKVTKIQFSPEHNPSLLKHNRSPQLKISRLYHGTSASTANNIMTAGFASLCTLDDGWFGKGVYFTDDPNYAALYCRESPPCLIVTDCILFNPYIVLNEDAPQGVNPSTKEFRFYGKGRDRTFYCNIAPVTRIAPLDYRPPLKNQILHATEYCFFEEHHTFPRAIAYLKLKNSSIPKALTWNVSTWVRSLLILDKEAEANIIRVLEEERIDDHVIKKETVGTILALLEENSIRLRFGDESKFTRGIEELKNS